MGNLAWSVPGQIDYDSGRATLRDSVRTMFRPLKGYIMAISWITDSLSGKVETWAQVLGFNNAKL